MCKNHRQGEEDEFGKYFNKQLHSVIQFPYNNATIFKKWKTTLSLRVFSEVTCLKFNAFRHLDGECSICSTRPAPRQDQEIQSSSHIGKY